MRDEFAARPGAGHLVVAGEIIEPRDVLAPLRHVAEGEADDAAVLRFGRVAGGDDVIEMAGRAVARDQLRFARVGAARSVRVQCGGDGFGQGQRQDGERGALQRAAEDLAREPAGGEDAAIVADDDDAVEIVGDDLRQHRARGVPLAGGFRVLPAARRQRGEQAGERVGGQGDVDAPGRREPDRPALQRNRARLDAEPRDGEARHRRQGGEPPLQRARRQGEGEDQRHDRDQRRWPQLAPGEQGFGRQRVQREAGQDAVARGHEHVAQFLGAGADDDVAPVDENARGPAGEHVGRRQARDAAEVEAVVDMEAACRPGPRWASQAPAVGI